MALTLWEFRTAQVPRVHGDVSSTSRVEADFIPLDDNTRRLGLHSVAYGLELRGEAPWKLEIIGYAYLSKIQEVPPHETKEADLEMGIGKTI